MAKKPARYPWQKWLDRKSPLRLVRGRDFDCQTYAMAQQFRNAAWRLGKEHIHVNVEGDTLTITKEK
jgi:hypothetical protein